MSVDEFNVGTVTLAGPITLYESSEVRESLQAALAVLADDAQLAHATSDSGLPVTKSATETAAYKQLVAQDPPTKAFADMFPYCGVDPTIPRASHHFRSILVGTAVTHGNQ